MSADGNISIQVAAEGVDDAANELGDTEVGGGGGDGGEGGGLGSAIRGGILGGILASALGPLLDVLSPMLKILQAFLAPVATMLLRLLSPVLRQFIRLLPAWFNFIDVVSAGVENAVSFLANLPADIWDFTKRLANRIWQAIKTGAAWFANAPQNIAQAIAGFYGTLADAIATQLKKVLPDDVVEQASDAPVGTTPLPAPFASETGSNLGAELAQRAQGGTLGGGLADAVRNNAPQANIRFEGGLSTFVENAERDVNFDFP